MTGDEDDVLSKVRKALEELDVGTAETRDALVDGVREAFDQIADSVKSGPDLRVVPDEDDPPEEPGVSVRWVSEAFGMGRIDVPGETEDPAADWQTVLHATEPRPYRLSIRTGVLEVVADDQPVSRLRPGQTVDIEARSIRVRGVGGPARGSYRPVHASSSR